MLFLILVARDVLASINLWITIRPIGHTLTKKLHRAISHRLPRFFPGKVINLAVSVLLPAKFLKKLMNELLLNFRKRKTETVCWTRN